MKVSLNWLKKYVDLENISTEDIVSKLTMSGLEVEEYFDQNEKYKNFVVGHVKSKEKHPDADKLTVCTVSDGNEDLQVICGASNVEAGQKIVFAPIGSTIPNGNFKIKKAKIRGVESHGMICAEDELELSDDHSGIMVLDENLEEGTSITEALGLNDVILEIAITPNRPDALSHIGVARDLSALFNLELKIPKVELKEVEKDINDFAKIEIEDEVNCPRYSARVVTDVTIKESPGWLKDRLLSIGLRPINNVVDVTNFVLHEIGQPLHAFDLDRLSKNKIIVRSTSEKTKFTTLDSKERELQTGTLMICDAESEVAVAGVMGGENSEVSDDTKNILIESAYFNPTSIRRTSKGLMLTTDSSYRFERGTDPSNTVYAAERAAKLIAELGDGKIVKGVIDVYPNKIYNKELKLRLARVTKLLGYEVNKNDVNRILQKLGINILKDLGDSLEVVVPNFRPDIEREVDLIEEIARIAGYDSIPTISKITITLDKKVDESDFTDKVRSSAIAIGMNEIVNNPLVPEKFAEIIGKPIKIANPQSNDMAFLRTSLVPSALNIVSNNIKRGEKDLAVFEIGNIFNLVNHGEVKSFEDFKEETNIILLITGYRTFRKWYSQSEIYDFYALKGLVNSFLKKISLDNSLIDSYNDMQNSIYEYNFAKSLNKLVLGYGGKVKSSVLKKFDIDQEVFCFEFDLMKLSNISKGNKTYSVPLKFPKVNRDFAFIFDSNINFEDVNSFIKKNASQLLKSVSLFDLFEKDDIGENKKSLAFNLEYYDFSRTLTEDEVDKDFQNLITLVINKFNASLRGN